MDGANANGNLLIGSIAYRPRAKLNRMQRSPTFSVNSTRRLKAFVQDGSAQVLSRPSVLTLDNRMAYINASEKIPIANTKFVKDYERKLISETPRQASSWPYVLRINQDGTEVSLQINASVSAPVPERIKLSGERTTILFWPAPTLSIREVKTYARIANDTPFIVGGLIAKDSEQISKKFLC